MDTESYHRLAEGTKRMSRKPHSSRLSRVRILTMLFFTWTHARDPPALCRTCQEKGKRPSLRQDRGR